MPKRVSIRSSNKEQNPNDLWDHAIPLESKRKEIDLIAEAKFMRELYLTNLPGEMDADAVNSYFDRLDESIKSGDTITGDTFISDDECDDDDESKDNGESTSDHPNPKKREYWYHSADLFKERASRHSPQSGGEDVDYSTILSNSWSATPDQHPVASDLPPISERTDGESSEDEWLS